VVELVHGLVHVLGSDRTAVDDRHTPKLYARFLRGLLAKQDTEGGDASQPSSRQQSMEEGQEAQTSTAEEEPYLNHIPRSSSPQPAISVVPAPTHEPHSFSTQSSDYLADPRYLTASPVPDDTRSGASTISAGFHEEDNATQYSMNDLIQTDEDFLASMGAITNPGFWDDVMPPGFAWPKDSPPWAASNLDSQMVSSIYGDATSLDPIVDTQMRQHHQ
jgi:hypothetical protein